ncbi:tubulin-folding cofactor E-like [Vigna umbellata]|uniref:tubulin-folding cofactor E-like n=1 Tax=Vigna umbellata TaxID=87088 RepID=UPI001F5EF086|nr:tubulin-folding cofactor E-like [Vigna umbellata]
MFCEYIGAICYRLYELKKIHGIEDERPSSGTTVPQTIGSGLLSITLNCVGASMGEKPPLTKKLPATTTVGKLKSLCESFFKLKSMKLKLYLQEEGSPFPLMLDNDTSSLMDLGIGNDSIILVDEEGS